MLKHPARAAAIALVFCFTSLNGFAQNSGADTYKTKCEVCHGTDGLGTQVGKSMAVRPYNAPDVLKLSDANLTAIIKNGKNKMPAFTGKLTDAQIKDLLAYIHRLQK